MGCGTSSNYIPVHAMANKEEEDQDQENVSNYADTSVDFNCMYRPEEFAVDFLDRVKYDPDTKLPFRVIKQMYLRYYTFLRPDDVDITYNYIFYNRLQPNILPSQELDKIELSCLQYVKFGYLFYRFFNVIKQPPMLLFYYLDDGFNNYVNYKNLKSLLRIHFGIDAKNAQVLFGRHKPNKSGYIGMETFQKIAGDLNAGHGFDPLATELKKERDHDHMPENFDVDIINRVEEIFSDISNTKDEIKQIFKDAVKKKQDMKREAKQKELFG